MTNLIIGMLLLAVSLMSFCMAAKEFSDKKMRVEEKDSTKIVYVTGHRVGCPIWLSQLTTSWDRKPKCNCGYDELVKSWGSK